MVLRDGKPIFAVKCKTGSQAVSKHLAYFSKRTEISRFYQVHPEKDDYEMTDLKARVMPFTRFATEALKV